MKDIVEKMHESYFGNKGSAFSEKVKYSKKDWEDWLNSFYNGQLYEKHLMIGSDGDMILIYIVNGKNIKHIASYNTKTTTLYTDDIKLFGHEI